MTEMIEKNIDKITEICKRHKVVELDLFGSLANGDFDENTSDIDFLVEFDDSVKNDRFDNFFHLLEELKKLFGRNVDLVEPAGLKNPYFIEAVNQTKRRIYAASN